MLRVIPLLVVLLPLTACGDDTVRVEGTLALEPGAERTLEVRGTEMTTLNIYSRSVVDLEMRTGPGGSEKTLGSGGSYRLRLVGKATIVIRNPSDQPAAIHYAASSRGDVAVTER